MRKSVGESTGWRRTIAGHRTIHQRRASPLRRGAVVTSILMVLSVVPATTDATDLRTNAEPRSFVIEPAAFEDVSLLTTQIIPNSVRRVGGIESATADIDGNDDRVDVDIAIVDTGVDATHQDLNVVGGVDCTGNTPGADFDDRDGHGTMVAGYAAAIDNAVGTVGVAPGARIWAARVVRGQGGITSKAITCALRWVLERSDTIDVVNMSLGGFDKALPTRCPTKPIGQQNSNEAILGLICELEIAGVVVVVSAGNDATDASHYGPAAFPYTMTVSAISDDDGRPGGLGPAFKCLPGEVDDTFATYSNFGRVVDIAAPGSCNASTYPGDQLAVASGTSFAAPLVAGAAALYLAKHPKASPATVRGALLDRVEAGPIQGDPDAYPEGVLNVSRL